jgi:CheY-like chemotaxis protein
VQTTINLPIQTITMDSYGMIVDAKSHSGMILGWDVNELRGQEVSQTLIPEHLRPTHIAGLAAVNAGKESKLANKRVPLDALHRDGHLVPIDLIVVVGQSNDPPVYTGMILSRQAGVQGLKVETPDVLPVLNITWHISIDLFPPLPLRNTPLNNRVLTTIRDACSLINVIGETDSLIDNDVTESLSSGTLKQTLLTPEVSMGIAKLLANPRDAVHFMECQTAKNGPVYWTEVILTVPDLKDHKASAIELHIQQTISKLPLPEQDSINPLETTRLIEELHNLQITTMAHWISHRINNHLTTLTLIFDIMDRNSRDHEHAGLVARGASSCSAIANLVASMSDTVGLSPNPSEIAPLPATIQRSIVRITSGRINTAPISLSNESRSSGSHLIDTAFADQLLGSICHLLAPRMGATSVSFVITDRYTLDAGQSQSNCHLTVVLHDAAFPLTEVDQNEEECSLEDSSQFGESVHMGDILTEPHLALAVVEKVCVSNNSYFSWSIDINRCVLEIQFAALQETAATGKALSQHKSTAKLDDIQQQVRYPTAVIVVEDESTVGQSICDALAKKDIKTYLASNSQEAFTVLRAHPDIEAAICDIVLGTEDGTSVATQMKQMTPKLRIVYMTGWAGHHRDVTALEAMDDIVLFKPIVLKKLLRTLQSAY